MTDLQSTSLMILVACVGFRWIAWEDDLGEDHLPAECQWGTCDCTEKCERREK